MTLKEEKYIKSRDSDKNNILPMESIEVSMGETKVFSVTVASKISNHRTIVLDKNMKRGFSAYDKSLTKC